MLNTHHLARAFTMAPMNSPETAPTAPAMTLTTPDDDVELVEEDLLVEEISIDGMCGVY
jgi:mycofactocin precursor